MVEGRGVYPDDRGSGAEDMLVAASSDENQERQDGPPSSPSLASLFLVSINISAEIKSPLPR
jgi:hypothetical protein